MARRCTCARARLLFLGAFAVGDVEDGADIAKEFTVLGKTRDALVVDPAILAVVPAQPIFDFEWLPHIERVVTDVEAMLAIVGMHAVYPSVAELLLDLAPGELEPSLIEEYPQLSGPDIQIRTGELSAMERKRRSLALSARSAALRCSIKAAIRYRGAVLKKRKFCRSKAASSDDIAPENGPSRMNAQKTMNAAVTATAPDAPAMPNRRAAQNMKGIDA